MLALRFTARFQDIGNSLLQETTTVSRAASSRTTDSPEAGYSRREKPEVTAKSHIGQKQRVCPPWLEERYGLWFLSSSLFSLGSLNQSLLAMDSGKCSSQAFIPSITEEMWA